MRKIIVSEFYALDGLMSDPQDTMDWVLSIFSEDVGKYEDDLYNQVDTLLLGRVTYKILKVIGHKQLLTPQLQRAILKWLIK